MALACCTVVILVHAARGMEPFRPFTSLPGLLGAFLFSGAASGLVYGLLSHWRPTFIGRFGLGAVIAVALILSVSLFSPGSGGSTADEWRSTAWFTLLGGVIGVIGFRPRRHGS